MKIFYRVSVFILHCLFRLFYRLSIIGTEIPFEGKAILAPNHASFLDPPLLGAAWPEEVHFLARATLFRRKAWRQLLSRLNAHPIYGTPQDIESFRLLCGLLAEGKKVVIFPEGVRSPTGELQPMKLGMAMLALRMQCPIIPVYIHGTFEAWPKHQWWPRLGSSVTCVFGKPIFPTFPPYMNKKQRQEAITRQVEKGLEELRLQFENKFL